MPTAPPVKEIYRRLYVRFGAQYWWPATPLTRGGEARPSRHGGTRRPAAPFEVMVGAILTQNTNWGNVERAIVHLKKAGQLSPRKLKEISPPRLARLIKPAGYFNVKAKRLKNFVDFLYSEYGGDLEKMAGEPLAAVREKLLNVNGIGPETADSILLYALNKSVFVIDAYTKRFLSRHNWARREDGYDAVQKLFMDGLRSDVRRFNEYHALIVRLGKDFCRTNPRCESCPLNDLGTISIHR